MRVKYRGTLLVVTVDDITLQDTDAIVNAANSRLAGGGGVDGAIHDRGGPAIMRELDVIRARQGGCPAGEAVITGGGALAAKYVIHTVGPVFSGRPTDADLLAACYRNSLSLAHRYGVKSLAFPSISTGAYRYPIDQAAPIAVNAVLAELPAYSFAEVRFILFSERDREAYLRVFAAHSGLTILKPD